MTITFVDPDVSEEERKILENVPTVRAILKK